MHYYNYNYNYYYYYYYYYMNSIWIVVSGLLVMAMGLLVAPFIN
jgi:hypothetical protein